MGVKLSKDILQKLYTFCAYQERCTADVEKKMAQLSIPVPEQFDYILHLQKEKFLNDKRFAEHFALGKFRNNKWGKLKIKQAMLQKQLPSSIIEDGLNQIPKEEYEEQALHLLKRKNASISENNQWKRKQKLKNYLLQKGFETELIFRLIERLSTISD